LHDIAAGAEIRSMRRTADPDAFVARPVGQYVSGRTWLLWCSDPALCGSIVWGRLEDSDISRVLVPFESLFSAQMAARCSVLTEASRLRSIEPLAFTRFAEFMERRRAEMTSRIARHAIVRPNGPMGALVAGFYEVLGQPAYPIQVFTDATDALRWLERPDAVALASEIDALALASAAIPDAVTTVRDLLSGNLDFRLAGAARAAGVSQRSLQRQLKQAGTSFRLELDAARIRAAQVLLAETDRKITAIALDVGCASLQHFSALFRRTTGHTPSAWRARQRVVASQ
jgi:AraC-like DNA-binding protein